MKKIYCDLCKAEMKQANPITLTYEQGMIEDEHVELHFCSFECLAQWGVRFLDPTGKKL